MPEYLDAEDTRWLSSEDELDEIELGWRAGWYLLTWRLGQLYSTEQAREQAAVSYMVVCVAERTSHVGREFPAAWWPPSAGSMS